MIRKSFFRPSLPQSLARQRQVAMPAGIIAFATLLCLGVLLVAGGCSGQSQTMVKAAAAEKAEDLTTAVSLYREELESHPENAAAIKGLAVDLYIMNEWDEALPMQEKAVKNDAKDAQTRIELGFNYMNHHDAVGKAVTVMREAVALEPSAKYLGFLGQAEAAAGDLQAAERTLRQAIDTDKAYGHAYTVLADVLKQQGRSAEAAQVLKDASTAGETASSIGGAQ